MEKQYCRHSPTSQPSQLQMKGKSKHLWNMCFYSLQMLAQFNQEMRAYMHINHDNVITIYLYSTFICIFLLQFLFFHKSTFYNKKFCYLPFSTNKNYAKYFKLYSYILYLLTTNDRHRKKIVCGSNYLPFHTL